MAHVAPAPPHSGASGIAAGGPRRNGTQGSWDALNPALPAIIRDLCCHSLTTPRGQTKITERYICGLYTLYSNRLLDEHRGCRDKPMRRDAGQSGADKDPIGQALTYLEKIRQGRVMIANGRPIPQPEQISGFRYIIPDLTPVVQRCCEQANLRITQNAIAAHVHCWLSITPRRAGVMLR